LASAYTEFSKIYYGKTAAKKKLNQAIAICSNMSLLGLVLIEVRHVEK